jgi:hypothetical protein
MAVEKWKEGTTQTLLSTELNSLGQNALALSGAVDNSAVPGNSAWPWMDLELTWAMATAAMTTGAVSIWFIRSVEADVFEDGSSSITPGRPPDATFFPRFSTAAVQKQIQTVVCPRGQWKLLLKHETTQVVSWAATGNQVRIIPFTREMI